MDASSTNSEIIKFCSSVPLDDHKRLGLRHSGAFSRVLRLSDDTVVKYGNDVTEVEARNQNFARCSLASSDVYVPSVLRFFTDQNTDIDKQKGYLVMEYIHGKELEPALYPYAITILTRTLDVMSSISGSRPGPCEGGARQGLLWSDEENEFSSVAEMEGWFNRRLHVTCGSSVSLQKLPLILCHLDIAPRNIIPRQDGRICLLDWSSAGFYPQIFEACVQRILRPRDSFHELVLDMYNFTSEEQQQIELICLAWKNSQERFFLPETETRSTRFMRQLDTKFSDEVGGPYPVPDPPVQKGQPFSKSSLAP
ncbi:hypothetical protein EV356DRAFT_571117 [Viridothelium virens]|uniref:Aminoglycoside phosphotransferase domain-containing protein n=1 Tax=Viridothelium virens TaxID=1048519 RepID=A0A6A6GUG0_VIRVR|nr:hypothetical protein EV356DRAFT_571117 [Viridothelium virens]